MFVGMITKMLGWIVDNSKSLSLDPRTGFQFLLLRSFARLRVSFFLRLGLVWFKIDEFSKTIQTLIGKNCWVSWT